MFQPALSWSTVRVWVPAGRVTVTVTVVQSWYPPVAGAVTLPLRLVPALLSMCRASVTAVGAASRSPTL